MPLPDHSYQPRWSLADIRFDTIDPALVRDDEFLFVTLTCASFVEILSDTYTGNLVKHFDGETDITAWLDRSWQTEEVQHGHALKAYVQAVWPEFDWERGHQAFKAEYETYCTMEQLEAKPGLEMVARCVIEMGTCTFYRAMHDYVREPVLRELLANIKADEAAHYTHFRRYFSVYNSRKKHGVLEVVRTIWRRLFEIRGEDAFIAFKHTYAQRHPGDAGVQEAWVKYCRTVRQLARGYYPYMMAVRMAIKPIPLYEPLKRLMEWPLIALVRLATKP